MKPMPLIPYPSSDGSLGSCPVISESDHQRVGGDFEPGEARGDEIGFKRGVSGISRMLFMSSGGVGGWPPLLKATGAVRVLLLLPLLKL